jgi:hypothetical protein
MLARQPVDQPLEMTLNEIDWRQRQHVDPGRLLPPARAARSSSSATAHGSATRTTTTCCVFDRADGHDPLRSVAQRATSTRRCSTRCTARTAARSASSACRAACAPSYEHTLRLPRRGRIVRPQLQHALPQLQHRVHAEAGADRALPLLEADQPAATVLSRSVRAVDGPAEPVLRQSDLRPSYTQSYSLDFSYTGSRGTIRVAPYYRHSTDIWERIRTVDADGVATSRWENAASGENYGSNFTLSLRPAGRLSGSVNVSVYRDVRDGSNISSAYRRAALMTAYGGNLGLKVTSLTAQAYANHFPAQSILQGKASGYTFMSLALRQQVWGTKGSVSLNHGSAEAEQLHQLDTR